ncbi:histone H1-like [Syngnathoides biaculeatus]|uniref:histone H1-like n=1 Tax=Syngnathoides biaculeatus TaxID=300417 RepID=UPI002ADDE15B|nr:histone H1-like [Syngnathoides biaculeatus]
MAEEAPAAAGPSKAAAKSKKKAGTRAPRRDGPSLSKQIADVIAESKDRRGTSVAAIKKNLAAKSWDVVKTNRRINTTLVNMAEKGILVQVRGMGASGSFKLAKRDAVAKPKADKKKSPAKKKPNAVKKSAQRVKKVPPKKVSKKAGKPKPANKKSKPASSPRKAAPKPKKGGKNLSPKKAKRTPVKKKNPAKKPAAKKQPSKKAKK